MKVTRNIASTVETIKPEVGAGFIRQQFTGKRLISCIIEILKNARDWGAHKVWISTDNGTFRFVDNGRGLNAANRAAYVSFNRTTARGARQSGKFGSGTKYFLYSHAAKVEVRTAPDDEPDFVYTFSFTPDELEQLVMSGGTLKAARIAKTAETWPYEWRFGSEFTYTMADPESRKILRGAQLAEELAARLPMRFENIVLVDDHRIPRKQVVGEVFQMDLEDDVLGTVNFEVYRAKARSVEDDLRFGSREIGEIPARDLVRNLGDLRSRFPEVLLLSEVAGTITCDYLRDFENEDRDSVRPEIADDPRSHHFVRMLENYAEEIERCLQIRLHSALGVDSAEQEIDQVVALCNERYDQGDGPPKAARAKDAGRDGDVGPKGPTRRKREHVLFSIEADRFEYELGETITITASIAEAISKDYGVQDIEWDTDQSSGRSVKRTKTGITLLADRIGQGLVRASLPGRNLSAPLAYRVVQERLFRFSMLDLVNLDLGTKMPLFTVNSDKVTGEIVWDLDGVGELKPEGARAIYTATESGDAKVIASDSRNKRRRAEILVAVRPGGEDELPEEMVCVRGVWFSVYHYGVVGEDNLAQPVSMISTGEDQQRLVINLNAPGFEAARQKGNLPLFLIQAIALEFARWSNFERGSKLEGLAPREFSAFTASVHAEAFQIFEDILKGKDGKA